MSQNNRRGEGQNNARRGTASHSTNYRGGRGGGQGDRGGGQGGRGGGQAGGSARLSNNGRPLRGVPRPGPARRPQVPFVPGMTIVAPDQFGSPVWDYIEGAPAVPLYVDHDWPTLQDPQVIWICEFGDSDEKILEPINQLVKDEAREMGFPCVIIRKEPHDRQFERTTTGHETTFIHKATETERRTLIKADLHLTVVMGDSLSRAHITGHIYLEKVDKTNFGGVFTNVRKMTDPATMRKFKPPGEEGVASEYWLLKSIPAKRLDNTQVWGV